MATTQMTKRSLGKRDLKVLLDSKVEEFTRALAGRMEPHAFLRIAYTSVVRNPQLATCTAPSVMMALLEAASLGLVPHGVMGEAYLVKYSTKVKVTDENGRAKEDWQDQAQLQVGYRGLVKLARQSGVIRTIVPRAVYRGEPFEVEYGTNENITHTPILDAATDTGMPLFVYAVAHFTDGTTQFEVMSSEAVDKIRARSKGADKGPWVTDYTEMALKTVVRRLCKRLPLSDFNLARALALDNQDFDLSGAQPGQQSQAGAAGLNARLRSITRKNRVAARAHDLENDESGVLNTEPGQAAEQLA